MDSNALGARSFVEGLFRKPRTVGRPGAASVPGMQKPLTSLSCYPQRAPRFATAGATGPVRPPPLVLPLADDDGEAACMAAQPWYGLHDDGPPPDTAFGPPLPAAARRPPLVVREPVRNAVCRFNSGAATDSDLLRTTYIALRACAADWTLAKACLDELDMSAHPITGRPVQPTASMCNAAIGVCDKARQADTAVRWFNEMIARRIPVDATTYSTVILACKNAGRPELAMGLLQHLLEHGPKRSVYPTTIMFNMVLAACANAGAPADALDVFGYLQAHGPALSIHPDTISYNTVIRACAQAGLADDAHRLLQAMESSGAAHGVRPDLLTYQSLFPVCSPEEKSDLLAKAVEEGLLRRSLGYDLHGNLLDLRQRAVLRHTAPAAPCVGVHPVLGRAIFDHLLRTGHFDKNTQFVVGRGCDRLKAYLEKTRLEQGWIDWQRSGEAGAAPAAPALNADAHEFVPS